MGSGCPVGRLVWTVRALQGKQSKNLWRHAQRHADACAARLCRNAVEKKTVLENLDLVLLAMDEIVDGG